MGYEIYQKIYGNFWNDIINIRLPYIYVLLSVLKADERLFQTGWMLESVISAMVVMLIVSCLLYTSDAADEAYDV